MLNECNYEFKSRSHVLYATPTPNPVPSIRGQARLLKNSNENTVPRTSPPPEIK